MTAETTSARDRLTRARLAFRRWRRSRPFWGGLFLIFSGFLIFYSGNLDLGNLQVHLGLPGFQSYIIPLVLALCGALVWATPAQRIFYGVIGLMAAVYSLVGANLGGFIVGFLFGALGGGLTVAWVPQKRQTMHAPDDATAELEDVQESQGLDVIDNDDDTPVAGVGGSPLHDTLPTSTQSPLVPPQSRHGDPSESHDRDDEAEEGKQGTRFPRPRHSADGSDVAGEANRSITTFRWSPRTAGAIVAVLAVASIAVVTLPQPVSAAAETCASSKLTELLTNAKSGKIATKPGGKTARTSTTKRSTTKQSTTAGAHGFVGFASVPSDDNPIDPNASAGPSASAQPSDSPSPTPSSDPSTAPSTSPKPSRTPTTGPTTAPTSTRAPTKASTPASRSPSPSAICTVTRSLAAAAGQPNINEKPSKMTAALLTMSGLSFDGIVPLPTRSGTMQVMQFSMSSSTSTPFELEPVSNNGKIDIKSSKLTVSTNVKFYCTEIKGNLLGTLPVDFTVDSPPPAVLPELYFTDVTIQLAFVYADTLTADSLNITVS